MQNENRDLRDRIEMYENVIGAQTYDVNQEAWKELLSPTKDGDTGISTTASEMTNKSVAPMLLGASNSNEAITSMMTELMEYRKGSANSQG